MSYSEKKEKRINIQAKDWDKEKKYLNLQQDIKYEKQQIKNKHKQQKRKLTTTKFLMFFLFFSCAFVELFTIYITIKIINVGFQIDLTPLTMLITAIVAEVIGFAIYALKSTKQNTKGGIIFETAINNMQNQRKLKRKNNIQQCKEEEHDENQLQEAEG